MFQAPCGFVVVDKDGEFLAWAAHIEVAIHRMLEMPEGDRVYRGSDDALLARKASRPTMPWYDRRSGGARSFNIKAA